MTDGHGTEGRPAVTEALGIGPPRTGLVEAPAGAPAIEVGRTVSGLDPAGLVARHGSPLYLYDVGVLRGRAAALRAALPDPVEIAYALKANSSPAVLAALAASGLGADVASGGELRAALRAGFAAERVVFTGPGKTDTELMAAIDAGVGMLTVESLHELEAVLHLAGRASPGQGLGLRLATEGEAEGLPIISAPGNVKFGLTDDEADEATARLLRAGALAPDGPFRLRGLHAFGASNVRDASELAAGVVELARRAERLAQRHGLEFELLDAGGGLGIPYADDEAPLDLVALGGDLADELATWSGRGGLRHARLLLEPGRWLSGPAGVYLCCVVRTKERAGRVVAVTDGGIHHLLRPRLVGQDHRIVPVGAAADRPADARIDLVGPLCTGLDFLATDMVGPTPQAGDLFAVLDAGAYGYSESMPLFLSHPVPAEVAIDGGAVTVSRPRSEP